MKKRIPAAGLFVFLALALLVIMVISASTGAAEISFLNSLRILLSQIPLVGRFIDTSDILPKYMTIVLNIRLPRVLLAGLAGCGLAVSGAVLQGLLRNPLADPQVLGISSGAAFGAAIAITLGLTYSAGGIGGIALMAFTGALATIFVVWKISFAGGRSSTIGILLAGISVSSLLTAAITLMMVMSRNQLEKVYLWMLGSFSSATGTEVIFLLLIIAAGLLYIIPSSSSLDIMMTGDESAESLGIDVEKYRRLLLIISSLMVAACVSVSGIIGFVGLIIPHIIRLLTGPKNARLIPLSCLGGAVFMILCDTIARTIAAPSEIPVGAITAVLGAPFFLFLLQRSRRKGGI